VYSLTRRSHPLHGAGRARIIVEVEARACPLRQLQEVCASVPVSTAGAPEYHTTLPGSEAVTAVTDYSSSSPLFFGRRVIQKIALTAIVDQADNLTQNLSLRGPRCQVVVRPTQSCEEIDGHSLLPVSALIYACVL